VRSGGGREAAAGFRQAKTLPTETAGVNISPVPERDFSTVPSGDGGAFRLSPVKAFNKAFGFWWLELHAPPRLLRLTVPARTQLTWKGSKLPRERSQLHLTDFRRTHWSLSGAQFPQSTIRLRT